MQQETSIELTIKKDQKGHNVSYQSQHKKYVWYWKRPDFFLELIGNDQMSIVLIQC